MYTALTEEIHATVKNQSEVLTQALSGATERLIAYKTAPKSEELVLLMELGFQSHPVYTEYSTRYNSLRAVAEEEEKLMEVQKKHPNRLILTQRQLDVTMEKYKLHKGEFKDFKESIPIANLKKIQEARNEYKLTNKGHYDEPNFKIVAPKEMFTDKPVISDDPIVVMLVGIFWVVITMWGREQFIPELSNPSNN